MKCAILLGLALLTFSCSKTEQPTLKEVPQTRTVPGCFIMHGSKFTKVLVHHYVFYDSLGNDTTQLSAGYLWITADKIKIQTDIENRCQFYDYDPTTQVYTMDGSNGACNTDYDINIGTQFVDVTIPVNSNHPQGTCYVKIIGDKL